VADRPAAVGGALDEAWLGEAVVSYPRRMELATRRAPGLVTGFPNAMVRARRLARAAGVATVAIWCADHAMNFVSKNCASMAPFTEALRDATREAVFFKRCGRSRAADSGALANLGALGRGVADLAPFGESRWCGINLTIESVHRCLPAPQAEINANQMAASSFEVVPAVEACILDPAFGKGLTADSPFLAPLFHCTRFLEADAAPLSSFLSAFVFLWLPLNGERVPGLAVSSRKYLRNRLSARCKRTVDPHVALALFLNAFQTPIWAHADSVPLGGKSTIRWRDQRSAPRCWIHHEPGSGPNCW